MANLLCVSIILFFILDSISYVNSQTTLSPTKEPTTEPTAEPTLEPTLNPLFTLISSTIHTPIPVPSPTPLDNPSTNSTFAFIEENYLWILIGSGALLCICCILLFFILRHKQHSKLKSELQKTNQAIKNEALKDEEKPMNIPDDTTNNNNISATDIYGHYNNQQLSNNMMQQLQQMQLMQQYQQTTNFQNPHRIAAYQALEFAPPINHSNDTWKNLNHLNPQQRMLQLMRQQQYIQQMANQAAIAMAYFIEQQQKLHQYELKHEQNQNQNLNQNQNQNLNQNQSVNIKINNNNIQNIHRQKVASLSYIDNVNNVNNGNNMNPMSMPMKGQNNINNGKQMNNFGASVPIHNNNNNNNLMNPMPKQRLDTMDDAAYTSGDLPPSIANDNVLNGNEPGDGENNNFDFNKNGENTFYDNIDEKTHVVNINENVENVNEINKQVSLVPPANPMEIPNVNVIGAQPNMRKLDSLPQEIPDLPFVSPSEEQEQYNNEYYQ